MANAEHVPGPSDNATWFGHPRQLARLFTTEMWERFGYYGMRALLTLYLVKHFGFSDVVGNGLYGAFTSLVYLTPLFGGMLADQYLGYKRSVKFGALLMAAGYLALCFGGEMAKPYLQLNEQNYPITERVLASGGTEEGEQEPSKVVTLDGVEYRIAGSEGDALKLEPVSGGDARLLAQGTFRLDAERDPFWVNVMFLALSCVIVGNGFFKPNISTMVGKLYAPGDSRRDGGFTIFYMGINIGSTISQFLCPLFQVWWGFWAGFLLAAIGMVFAYLLFQFDGGRLKGIGDPPTTGMGPSAIIFIVAILAIPVVTWLLLNTMNNAEAAANAAREGQGILNYLLSLPLLGKVLFGIFFLAIIGIPVWALVNGTKEEFQKMVVAIVLTVFSVVFWTLFEQAGSSLTLFADRNTDLTMEWTRPFFAMLVNYPFTRYIVPLVIAAPIAWLIYKVFASGGTDAERSAVGVVSGVIFVGLLVAVWFGVNSVDEPGAYVMPAAQTQIFNPIFIVLFAPLLSWLWVAMARRKMEPSIPIKFAIGLLLVGLGFLTLVYGARFSDSSFKVALFWLGMAYFLHSIGELCLSPIGLSMITKLSMARVVGLMFGVWFLSSAMAQYVGGIVAQAASTETVAGEVTDPEKALATSVGVFTYIGWAGMIAGVILLVIAVPLKRMMHGVR